MGECTGCMHWQGVMGVMEDLWMLATGGSIVAGIFCRWGIYCFRGSIVAGRELCCWWCLMLVGGDIIAGRVL